MVEEGYYELGTNNLFTPVIIKDAKIATTWNHICWTEKIAQIGSKIWLRSTWKRLTTTAHLGYGNKCYSRAKGGQIATIHSWEDKNRTRPHESQKNWSGQAAKPDLRSLFVHKLVSWTNRAARSTKHEPKSLASYGCVDPRKADRVRSGVHEPEKEAAWISASGRIEMQSRGLHTKCRVNHCRRTEQAKGCVRRSRWVGYANQMSWEHEPESCVWNVAWTTTVW